MSFNRLPNTQVNFVDLLTQHLEVGCWVFNLNDDSGWWSDKLYELLGLAKDSITVSLKNFTHTMVHPEDRKKVQSLMECYRQGNLKAHHQEVRLYHSSGKYRWFELFGEVKMFDGDESKCIVGGIKNIDARKQFQLESEKLKFMMDVAEDMAGIGALERNFITGQHFWSRKVYGIFELPEDTYMQQEEVLKFFEEKSRQRLQQALYKLRTEKHSFDEELLITTAKGNKRWVRCMAKPIIDERGEVTGVRGLFENIDKKINNELLLSKYLEKLEARKFFLKEKSTISKMGGWELDFNERTVYWDEQTKAIHEVAENFKPSFEDAISFYEQEDQALLKDLFGRMRECGDPFDIELHFVTASRRKIWVRCIGKPVCDKNKKVTGARGIFQNIHDQKIKSLRIENSAAMIRRQNEKLTNFAHIVSHNLRTHTSNLKLLAQMIEQEDSLEEKLSWLLNVRNVSDALDETVNGLTELVRSHYDMGEAKSNVEFSSTINNVCKAIELNGKGTDIELSTDFEQCPAVEYVPAYLESIMLNLVTNAIKYRHPERKPKIRIRTYIANGKPCMEITDNGRGIDLQTYGHKLFGLNQTFHGNRDARGIGLYITKNHIENLGGSIMAESSLDVGTTFKVTF